MKCVCVCVEGTDVTTVTEWYQHRNDHLEQREVNKVDSFTKERFKHGRRFHLLGKFAQTHFNVWNWGGQSWVWSQSQENVNVPQHQLSFCCLMNKKISSGYLILLLFLHPSFLHVTICQVVKSSCYAPIHNIQYTNNSIQVMWLQFALKSKKIVYLKSQYS